MVEVDVDRNSTKNINYKNVGFILFYFFDDLDLVSDIEIPLNMARMQFSTLYLFFLYRSCFYGKQTCFYGITFTIVLNVWYGHSFSHSDRKKKGWRSQITYKKREGCNVPIFHRLSSKNSNSFHVSL